MMARPSVVLPEPELADDAQRLARAQLEREPVDRLDVIDGAPQRALLDRKPDLQVVGLDDDGRAVVGGRRRALWLGSEQMARVGDACGAVKMSSVRALFHDLAASA